MPAFDFLYSSGVPCLEVRQENLALEWNHHYCTGSWTDVTKCSDIYKSFDCQEWLDALLSQTSVYCFFIATLKESVIRLYVLSRKGYNKGEIPSLEILKMKSRALTCLDCFFNVWNHKQSLEYQSDDETVKYVPIFQKFGLSNATQRRSNFMD